MKQQYRSAKRRADWVVFFLVAYGVLTIASIVSAIAEINLLQQVDSGQFVSNSEINANARRQTVIALLYTPALVGVVITFLMWMHRASVNLAVAGAPGRQFSPGKSDFPALPMLNFWWGIGAWLVSIWPGGIPIFLSEITFGQAVLVSIAAMTFRVIALVFLIRAVILMWRITSDQEKKHAAVPSRIEPDVTVADTDAETAAAISSPATETLPPPAGPPRDARCARCGKEMSAAELPFGICNEHIAI